MPKDCIFVATEICVVLLRDVPANLHLLLNYTRYIICLIVRPAEMCPGYNLANFKTRQYECSLAGV